MPECEHCGHTLDSEQAYREHLQLRHGETPETTGERTGDEPNREKWLYVGIPIAVVLVLGLAAFGLSATDGYGGDTPDSAGQEEAVAASITPNALGSRHVHGQIEVVIDGNRIDFGERRYQLVDEYFHMEGGDDDRWHVHGRDVSLEYAINTFPNLTIGPDSVTYDGRTYADGADVTVEITVNGDPVDPRSHVLEDGDDIRIVVRTDTT